MRIKLKDIPARTHQATIDLVHALKPVVDQAAASGEQLSIRQVYYAGVTKGLIPSSDEAYNKMKTICTHGRMWGFYDWDVFEDRDRDSHFPYWYNNLEESIEEAIIDYRLNRMEGQGRRYVIFLEKKALQNPFIKVGAKYGIRVLPTKGDNSLTWVYEYSKFMEDGDCVLAFYDHDPKGLRIRKETIAKQFKHFGLEVNVINCGLNIEHIKERPHLVPFPAKVGTDSNAIWYIEQTKMYDCYELDALTTKELEALCESEILKVIDLDKYNAMLALEEQDRREYIKFKNSLNGRN